MDHARFGSKREQLAYVELPDSLDVNGAAKFVSAVVAVRVEGANLVPLCELEGFDDIVDAVLDPPGEEVGHHQLNVLDYELAGSAEAQNVVVVEIADGVKLLYFDPRLDLLHDLLLLGRHVVHKAAKFFWFGFRTPHFIY